METITLESVPSTNTWVKEHVEELLPKAPVCVRAMTQTAGRGRNGKSWVSPPCDNVYVSFFYAHSFPRTDLSWLGILLSLAAVHVIEKEGVCIQLKWPNDLFLQRKKCGGVLVEIIPQGVILGIGINLNSNREALSQIDQEATSLKIETNRLYSVPFFIEQLSEELSTLIHILEQKGGNYFLDEYTSRLIHQIGDRIAYRVGDKSGTGHYVGMNEEGHIVLATDRGLRVFSSATIEFCD